MQSWVWVRVKVCEEEALRPEGKKLEIGGSMRKGEGSIVQQEGLKYSYLQKRTVAQSHRIVRSRMDGVPITPVPHSDTPVVHC